MRRILLVLVLAITGCQSAIDSTEVMATATALPSSTPIILPTAEPTATPTLTPSPTPDLGKRYTAVLMGLDLDSFGWGARTDIFIIITALVFEDAPARIHMIHVPRDLLVSVYNQETFRFYQDRVNAAYFRGDFDGVRNTVKRTFGLDVNAGMAVVDPLGFLALVDTMDGLIIDPYQDFYQVCPHYDRDAKFVMILDSDQAYRLNGEKALCYARHRGFGFKDRIYRAHDLILGFQGAFLPSIAEGDGLIIYNHYKTYVRTSVELEDIIGMLDLVTKIRGAAYFPETFELGEDMEFYVTERGASVLRPLVDLEQWMADILE